MEKKTDNSQVIRDTYTAKELLLMARQTGLSINETVRIIQEQQLSTK